MYWIEFKDIDNSKEYEVKTIYNSKVYTNQSNGHLLGHYYLVSQKGYPKEENIYKPTSAV